MQKTTMLLDNKDREYISTKIKNDFDWIFKQQNDEFKRLAVIGKATGGEIEKLKSLKTPKNIFQNKISPNIINTELVNGVYTPQTQQSEGSISFKDLVLINTKIASIENLNKEQLKTLKLIEKNGSFAERNQARAKLDEQKQLTQLESVSRKNETSTTGKMASMLGKAVGKLGVVGKVLDIVSQPAAMAAYEIFANMEKISEKQENEDWVKNTPDFLVKTQKSKSRKISENGWGELFKNPFKSEEPTTTIKPDAISGATITTKSSATTEKNASSATSGNNGSGTLKGVTTQQGVNLSGVKKPVIDGLKKMTNIYGKPIQISSGFRDAKKQASLRGKGTLAAKGKSFHELGQAIDIGGNWMKANGVDVGDLMIAARESGFRPLAERRAVAGGGGTLSVNEARALQRKNQIHALHLSMGGEGGDKNSPLVSPTPYTNDAKVSGGDATKETFESGENGMYVSPENIAGGSVTATTAKVDATEMSSTETLSPFQQTNNGGAIEKNQNSAVINNISNTTTNNYSDSFKNQFGGM